MVLTFGINYLLMVQVQVPHPTEKKVNLLILILIDDDAILLRVEDCFDSWQPVVIVCINYFDVACMKSANEYIRFSI